MNLFDGDAIELKHEIDLKSAGLVAAFIFLAIVLGFALGTAIFKR